MRSGDIPFKFDVTDLVARARRQVSGRVGNVTLNLPFVSIEVSPKDRERKVAREIVLRLRDRRVLSAWECCDNCIDNALASLREIRQIIYRQGSRARRHARRATVSAARRNGGRHSPVHDVRGTLEAR